MSLKLPDSMDELVYWTKRKVGEGKVTAWVYRGDCPSCGKAKMEKPKGSDGKVKIRAKYYECPNCGNKIDKQEYEDTLDCNCLYICPECKKPGESVFPYKRKSYKGVKALVFSCDSCGAKIPITKKMKGIK